MFCQYCEEEMSPLKGLISISDMDTCCVPCWGCHKCGNVLYLKNEKEFDLWLYEYTNEMYSDPEEDLGFHEINNLSIKIIEDD